VTAKVGDLRGVTFGKVLCSDAGAPETAIDFVVGVVAGAAEQLSLSQLVKSLQFSQQILLLFQDTEFFIQGFDDQLPLCFRSPRTRKQSFA